MASEIAQPRGECYASAPRKGVICITASPAFQAPGFLPRKYKEGRSGLTLGLARQRHALDLDPGAQRERADFHAAAGRQAVGKICPVDLIEGLKVLHVGKEHRA